MRIFTDIKKTESKYKCELRIGSELYNSSEAEWYRIIGISGSNFELELVEDDLITTIETADYGQDFGGY